MFESPHQGQKFESKENITALDDLPAYLPLSKPYDKLQAILKRIGLAALLATSLPSVASAQESRQAENNESLKIAESVLGTNLIEQYEALGFQVQVPLPAEAGGKYVIHVGQTHLHPDGGIAGFLTQDKVLEFQTKLKSVLEDTSKAGDGVVFAEGFGDDPSKSKENVIKSAEHLKSLVTSDISSLNEIQNIQDALKWFFENRNHPFVLNYIDDALIETISKKVEIFLNQYIPKTEEEGGLVEVYQMIQKVNKLAHSLEESLGQVSGTDAISELYMEGKFVLAPAETREANKVVHELRGQMQTLQQEYSEQFNSILDDTKINKIIEAIKLLLANRTESDLNESEQLNLQYLREKANSYIDEQIAQMDEGPIAQRLDEVTARHNYLTLDVREQIAVEKMTSYPVELSHYVIVYGSSHEFAREIKNYNTTNQPNQIDLGLIEIKIPK